MLAIDTDEHNWRNSYSRSDYRIQTLKKFFGNIKSVTKDAGLGPKILDPTGSSQHTYVYTLPVYSLYPIHGCLYTMIIACFSIALPIRYIIHKCHLNQVVRLRKYHEMLIQLLFITALYLRHNMMIHCVWCFYH